MLPTPRYDMDSNVERDTSVSQHMLFLYSVLLFLISWYTEASLPSQRIQPARYFLLFHKIDV